MMRIDFYFDFNNDNYDMINNLKEALSSFVHKEDITLTFRSYPLDNENYYFHNLYHYGRKKDLDINYLLDLYNLYFKKLNLEELITKYNLNDKEINDINENKTYYKVIKNQHEYAGLLNITKLPSINLSHGFKLRGVNSPDTIKDTLILMYEKDSGIEYCEDDCDR